ncbi:WxL domain-containing protein [Latilactobacillus curvatus]|uniref:WxL domain-containing protein n=1 Tax=Latilactobacillus curvatus TaxID=28038 RepID=UPI0013E2B853|nr:WxL domain-containing protein [Latilactobacillus curvatus]
MTKNVSVIGLSLLLSSVLITVSPVAAADNEAEGSPMQGEISMTVKSTSTTNPESGKLLLKSVPHFSLADEEISASQIYAGFTGNIANTGNLTITDNRAGKHDWKLGVKLEPLANSVNQGALEGVQLALAATSSLWSSSPIDASIPADSSTVQLATSDGSVHGNDSYVINNQALTVAPNPSAELESAQTYTGVMTWHLSSTGPVAAAL